MHYTVAVVLLICIAKVSCEEACGDRSTPRLPFGEVSSLFNVLVFEDFTCKYSDTEGRLAAGKKIDVEGFTVGCKVFNNDPNSNCIQLNSITCGDLGVNDWKDTVVAGENINYLRGQVMIGNVAHETGFSGQSVALANGCSAQVTSPIDFDAEKTYLTKLSQITRDLESTGTVVNEYGNLVFIGTDNANREVFEVTAAQLAGSHTLTLRNVASGATVVINVAGSSVSISSLGFAAFDASKTLWNFHEATTLTLQNIGFKGTILAPLTDVTNPRGQLDGQVFAKSWKGQSACMQLNEKPFTGCIVVPDQGCPQDQIKYVGTIGTESVEIIPFNVPQVVDDYYDYRTATSSSHAPIVEDNEDKALVTIVTDGANERYIVIILDKRDDTEGGSASITITHTGDLDGAGVVVSDDPPESTVFAPGVITVTRNWNPCCTDGVVIGPIPDGACFDVTLGATTGITHFRLGAEGTPGGTLIEVPKQDNVPVTLSVCGVCTGCPQANIKYIGTIGSESVEVLPFYVNQDVKVFYAYQPSSSYAPIVEDNEDKALVTIVTGSDNKRNIVIILDKRMDNEGGSATIKITHNGDLDGAGVIVNDDPEEVVAFAPGVITVTRNWNEKNTDGVVLGPIPDDACFEVTLEQTTGINYFRLGAEGTPGGTLIQVPKTNDEPVTLSVCGQCVNK